MLKVFELSKSYNNTKVLDSLSFELRKGEVLGLLGPNGSGKSTCIKILAGIIASDSGRIEYFEKHFLENIKLRSLVSYIPEVVPVYPDLTVLDAIKFAGRMKGLIGDLDKIITDCQLWEIKNSLCSSLSKGMRQRLGLAQALISNPEIILLDEPATGLDPAQLEYFHDIISEYSQNSIIIISSHQFAEINKVCSRVVGLSKGKQIFNVNLNEEKQDLETLFFENLI